jgi:hypothetical protein
LDPTARVFRKLLRQKLGEGERVVKVKWFELIEPGRIPKKKPKTILGMIIFH